MQSKLLAILERFPHLEVINFEGIPKHQKSTTVSQKVLALQDVINLPQRFVRDATIDDFLEKCLQSCSPGESAQDTVDTRLRLAAVDRRRVKIDGEFGLSHFIYSTLFGAVNDLLEGSGFSNSNVHLVWRPANSGPAGRPDYELLRTEKGKTSEKRALFELKVPTAVSSKLLERLCNDLRTGKLTCGIKITDVEARAEFSDWDQEAELSASDREVRKNIVQQLYCELGTRGTDLIVISNYDVWFALVKAYPAGAQSPYLAVTPCVYSNPLSQREQLWQYPIGFVLACSLLATPESESGLTLGDQEWPICIPDDEMMETSEWIIAKIEYQNE